MLACFSGSSDGPKAPKGNKAKQKLVLGTLKHVLESFIKDGYVII